MASRGKMFEDSGPALFHKGYTKDVCFEEWSLKHVFYREWPNRFKSSTRTIQVHLGHSEIRSSLAEEASD